MTTQRYEGERLYAGATVFCVNERGWRRRLEHRVRTGNVDRDQPWDWGYAGDRARELGLNILADAVGEEEATCLRCRGTGYYRVNVCFECRGLRIAEWICRAGQPFTRLYVAGLPEQHWVLHREDVLRWLDRVAETSSLGAVG